jgi:hypothetical protein
MCIRSSNFDTIHEPDKKLLNFSLPLTGLTHKWVNPFILFQLGQPAGDPPHLFKLLKKKKRKKA